MVDKQGKIPRGGVPGQILSASELRSRVDRIQEAWGKTRSTTGNSHQRSGGKKTKSGVG
jgi:hypothetical protein